MWSGAEFAAEVGVSRQAVNNWIKDNSLPTDLAPIERALFGMQTPSNHSFLEQLRAAYFAQRRIAVRRLRTPTERPSDSEEVSRRAQSHRLHVARQSMFPTASAAARQLGIASATYLSHENGTRQIRPDIADFYAQQFGVSTDWLLYGRGPSTRERREHDYAFARLQTYVVTTPLISAYSIVAVSMVIGQLHNQMRPLAELLSLEEHVILRFERSGSLEDLWGHVTADVDPALAAKIRTELVDAIDKNAAVIYRGSVKSLQTSQIAKLPDVIKCFARLSDRQFRVGLLRLGTTLVVLGVCAGAGTYAGWQAAEKIREVAALVLKQSIPASK